MISAYRAEVTGGPAWVTSDTFAVDAKVENPSATTDAQLRLVLQSLLKERFKLEFHRETKQVPGICSVRRKRRFETEAIDNGETVHRVRTEGIVLVSATQPAGVY